MQQRLLRNDGGPRTFAVVLDTGDEVSSKGAAQQDIGYAVIASGRRRARIQKLARCRPGLSHRLGGAHRQRGGRRNGDHHARTEFLGRIRTAGSTARPWIAIHHRVQARPLAPRRPLQALELRQFAERTVDLPQQHGRARHGAALREAYAITRTA